MLELPFQDRENDVLSHNLCGRQIVNVIVTKRPHKLTSYYNHPENYLKLLMGKTIEKVSRFRGITQIDAGGSILIFSDGVNLTLYNRGIKPPADHQLLLYFEDTSFLAASVDIYGAIWCYKEEELVHPYFGVRGPAL